MLVTRTGRSLPWPSFAAFACAAVHSCLQNAEAK